MGAFTRFCQTVRSSAVRVGERVRIVEMDGCMAHVRGRVREGIVVALSTAPVYGEHGRSIPWADIRLDDGYVSRRPAQSHLWTRHKDGTMEHHV